MKKTKIVCSIGPASSSVEVMTEMVKAGMNVARINCSHATVEEKAEVTETVKEVRKITGAHVSIMYDTKGPEFRSGMLKNNEIKLVEGKNIKIVKEEVLGNEERISVNHPKAIDSLKIGSYVFLQNGLMKVEVVSIDENEKGDRTGVTCKILNGGILGNKKSLCAPGVKLDIPFISSDDEEDLIYACEHDCDMISLSFVTAKEDVMRVREILSKYNRKDIKLISKIESQTGFDNLDSIIDVSDGIMVGRGDLGDEIEFGNLPKYQKHIVKRCREKGKAVIVATEMMDSMIKSARPTRAEVLDVANAVLDGTDAVMLSGETTIGKFPVEVVKYMAEICRDTEEYYDYNQQFESERKNTITETIANSVVSATKVLNTKLIIASTETGETARVISNLKPECLILAATPNEAVARALSLNYGVYSIIVPNNSDTDEMIRIVKEKAKEIMNLEKGDNIIITGGFPKCGKQLTNLMKIEEI